MRFYDETRRHYYIIVVSSDTLLFILVKTVRINVKSFIFDDLFLNDPTSLSCFKKKKWNSIFLTFDSLHWIYFEMNLLCLRLIVKRVKNKPKQMLSKCIYSVWTTPTNPYPPGMTGAGFADCSLARGVYSIILKWTVRHLYY